MLAHPFVADACASFRRGQHEAGARVTAKLC